MAGKPDPSSARLWRWAIAAAGLAVALKVALMTAGVFPFNSDEAIVALMARHILQGNWPTFFYGQAYLGSLDAALVAAGFWLVGEKVTVIRAVQTVLYVGTLLTTVALARQVTRSWAAGAIAGLFMAVPTVNVTLYTTVSLGGYGEALLIGNLLLLVALAGHAHPDRWPLFALWAILAGIGFWAFGLTLVYIVPTGALLMWLAAHRPDWRRRLGTTGVMVAGFVVGASPWIAWAAVHGLTSLFQELAGSAIAGASSASLAQTLGARSLNLALFGSTVALGLRPPWVIRWLGIPLMPLVLGFWVAVAVWAAGALGKRDGRRLGGWLLAGVVVLLAAGFVLTPFGADPSGRYFVPLAVPMAIAGGGAIEDWRSRLHTPWIYAVAAVVLLFNLWGTLEGAKANPPGITTQFDAVTQVDHRYDAALMTFLDTVGESRGYTNYWVAYPLAFLSGEQLTFVPRLPYHLDFRYTPRDDRYPPYDVAVAEAERVAYVVTLHPALETRLRAAFTSLGVRWKERRIGDYEVFFELSRKVTPEEIGL